jgi:putative flippase GtrA
MIARTLDNLIAFLRKFPILKKFPVNFYRFVVVGLTVFVIDFILFNTLYHLLGFQTKLDLFNVGTTVVAISLPNLLSVAISTVVGYILNKTWSFENKSDNVASQFSKYVAVAIFNNTLNNVIFGLLLYNVFTQTDFHTVIETTVAKILATSFQVVSSYLLYKFVVFKEEKEVVSEALVP